jgi:serine/threonine-protein kinase HSL1 (negative regulator of Swe1 kinase)
LKTGQYAAVKIVSKNILMNSIGKLVDSSEQILLSIEREIVIMKLIDHPNIMRLYDVWETSTKLYLILEYVEGGELFDYLCSKGRLSTFEALAYFQQIISAIDYCHRFNIAHRDLKPENLLMDQDGNIKVADFGMAAWQASSTNGLLQTACGSPHYAAPEIIMGKQYDGRAADIWSCGVILFALLVGHLPFDDEDLPTLLDKVESGIFDMPSGMDPLAKDLITKMLQKDVVQRITIPQILTHPFYLSQQSKSVDVDMPKLDDTARPLSADEEIDQDILANLRTLWHGTSEEVIEASLKSSEPNWQKGVYRLLTERRGKYLSDYDEEEDLAHRKKRSKISTANERQRVTMTSSQGSYLAHAASLTSCRAVCCTPHKDDVDLHSFMSPSYLTSSTSPVSLMLGSANLPMIQVPELKDDKMQHFFQQIVEYLHAIEVRTAGPPRLSLGTSAPSMPDNMESGKHENGHTVQTINHSSCQETLSDVDVRCGRRSQFREVDNENLHLGGIEPAIVKKSSLGSDGGDKHSVLRVHFTEPSPSKLRKKSGGDTPTTSHAFSDSSSMLPSTPRRCWLDSVLRFKPATYHLLSTHNGFTTREECHHMLVNLGVLTHAESAGVLRCRTDATKNVSGLLPALKSVQFRVKVQRPTSIQIATGYQVVLYLTHEKGSWSSFQWIYNMLRRNWELDAPRRPIGPNLPLVGHTETGLKRV